MISTKFGACPCGFANSRFKRVAFSRCSKEDRGCEIGCGNRLAARETFMSSLPVFRLGWDFRQQRLEGYPFLGVDLKGHQSETNHFGVPQFSATPRRVSKKNVALQQWFRFPFVPLCKPPQQKSHPKWVWRPWRQGRNGAATWPGTQTCPLPMNFKWVAGLLFKTIQKHTHKKRRTTQGVGFFHG